MSDRPSPAERLQRALAPELVQAIEDLIADTVQHELERDRDERAWLTVEQAASRYQTTPDALRKRAQRGTLPGAVRDGSRWLVDARAFDAALERSTLSSTETEGPHRVNGRARGTGG